MRIVIIDDEEQARNQLQKIITNYCKGVAVVGEARGVREGYQVIQSQQPDIVFVDILMPDGTGFDLLEQFPDRNFDVVFATGFNQFAIQAFKVSAIDYLCKPVLINDVINAIQKVIERPFRRNDLKVLEENLSHNLSNPDQETLAVIGRFKIDLIEINNVVRLHSEKKYVDIYTLDKKVTSPKALKEYESILKNKLQFIRVHQSHIINMKFIDHVDRKDGSYIVMKDQSTIPISRSFKEKFMNYLREMA
ncbi:LytR/AlgR family response regulator transcription factor [Aquimarina rhabdastrellae]